MSGFLADADLSVNAIERARATTPNYIDLTSSNPTHQGLLFPPDILRAAAEPYWSARRYEPDPKGTPLARSAIAQYYARRECLPQAAQAAARPPMSATLPDIGADIAAPQAAAEIVVTASTSEAYGLLFTLLTRPGDNIIGPDVTYPLFEHLAEAHHVELRTYHLDEARGWRIDEASVQRVADRRTRAVLVVSPHNPTGMIVDVALGVLNGLGLPVICDEVFAQFVYRAAYTPVLAALHPALPVFTLSGISKLFALPDLKLGWIAINRAALPFAQRLEFLNDAYLSANSLTQFMLPALFEQGQSFVDMMQTRIRAALDMGLDILSACPSVSVQPPAGGYYLFPRIAGWHDEEALVLHLLAHGVLAHPGFFYGLDANDAYNAGDIGGSGAHLMISCLTEPGKLREGLQRLTRALSISATAAAR